MSRPKGRRALFGLIGGVLALIWASYVVFPHIKGNASFVDGLESTLLDARFRTFGANPPPDNVVIVAIDDATLADTKADGAQGRDLLALIIETIAVHQPKAMAVDVLFTDIHDPASDAALIAALGKIPSTIAAAGNFDGQISGAGLPETDGELWPQTGFSNVAQVGFVNIVTDTSGTPRHVPLLFKTSHGISPSLMLQAAILYSGETPRFSTESLTIGPRTIPLDQNLHMPLRLAGPSGTIPTLSAQDVLAGKGLDHLTGKLVVLGFTASALGDRFPTPFDPSTPGVEIIATGASQLLGAETLQRDSMMRKADAGLAILLAVVCTVLVVSLPLSVGLPIAVGLLLAGLVGVWLAFPIGYWFNAATLVVGVVPPLVLASAGRYLRERHKAAKTDRSLSALKQFQSPVLAELIADDPGFLQTPETHDLIVFFIDLSGFTQLSQDMGPSTTEDFLKRFHTVIAHEIEGRSGIIFNYMGDGAMAVFGLEQNLPDPAGHAMGAAMALLDSISALGKAQGFSNPLGCRIGLHKGPVILSRLGHDRHQQVSITGDSVNLASRLMEIAKDEGASVAATSEFMDAMERPMHRQADDTKDVPVRGRAGDVQVSLWRS